MDPAQWGPLKDRLTALFATKTRDQWCAIMEMTDICFAPVMSLEEAPQLPHNVERKTFVEVGGAVTPAPAQRYSATRTALPRPRPQARAGARPVLVSRGYDAARLAEFDEHA